MEDIHFRHIFGAFTFGVLRDRVSMKKKLQMSFTGSVRKKMLDLAAIAQSHLKDCDKRMIVVRYKLAGIIGTGIDHRNNYSAICYYIVTFGLL